MSILHPNKETNEQLKTQELVTTVIDERVSSLEEKIAKLELQQKYYSLQKDWEFSIARIVMVVFSTYIFVALVLFMLDERNFWLDALLPAGGYIVTQMSIPYVHRLWVKWYVQKQAKSNEKTFT